MEISKSAGIIVDGGDLEKLELSMLVQVHNGPLSTVMTRTGKLTPFKMHHDAGIIIED